MATNVRPTPVLTFVAIQSILLLCQTPARQVLELEQLQGYGNKGGKWDTTREESTGPSSTTL